jgi:Lon protease-like protein
MARVQDWPDDDADSHGPETDDEPGLVRCIALMRRALALCAELGVPAAPATVEVSDDPATCAFQLASLAPLGPADHQRLLAAPSRQQRLALLEELLGDAIILLDGRLRTTEG